MSIKLLLFFPPLFSFALTQFCIETILFYPDKLSPYVGCVGGVCPFCWVSWVIMVWFILLTVLILHFNLFSFFNHTHKLSFRMASLPHNNCGQELSYLYMCERNKVATDNFFSKKSTKKLKMDVIIFLLERKCSHLEKLPFRKWYSHLEKYHFWMCTCFCVLIWSKSTQLLLKPIMLPWRVWGQYCPLIPSRKSSKANSTKMV